MFRLWSRVATLCVGVLLTLVGLAREEKPAEPTFGVPANCELYVSLRVADAWNGPLGKQIRTVFGKDLDAIPDFKNMAKEIGIGPESLTRVTILAKSLKEFDSSLAIVLQSDKPMATRELLARTFSGSKPQKVHGLTLEVMGNRAAYASPDRQWFMMGNLPMFEAMLDPKAKKPEGLLAKVVDRAKTEHAAGYIVPTMFAGETERIPVFLAALRPLLVTKEAGGWASLGYETKAEGQLRFADEKAAQRGYKSVNAMRTLATVSLSGLSETFAAKSKPLAAFLGRVEKTLEEAPLEHKDTTVTARLALKVEKDEIATLIKEAVLPLREMARRQQAQNNLKQIALAMHNFESANGSFPASATYDKDGKALLSWRVHLLPYVEQDALYREFKLDEPWDSDHNKKLIAKMPRVYQIPDAKASMPGGTFYQVFTGKGTVFEGKRGRSILGITDGTSNTLMVVEAAKDVPWTKPDDLPFDPEAKMPPKLGGHFEGGFNAAFCDGSVRFLKSTIALEVLKAIITQNGGEVIGKLD